LNIKYRPEIDGLRAISVIAVIIYHLKINLFGQKFLEGGFFGVDIFFVISGYLITQLILNEIIITNNFNFKNFYSRRIRRLLPLLLLVIIFSIPLGWKYMLPTDFMELSKSTISSIFFSSNLYFYFSGVEYIKQDSLLQPLLHTWSLSVEEQFYIVFPIFFFFIYKKINKLFLPSLISIFILSFCFSIYGSINFKFANFYFLFSRIWEIIFGSIIAFIEVKRRSRSKNLFLNQFFQFLGVILIFISFINFNDEINHPSMITLIPVLGVGLIIWFSNGNEIVTRILSSKVLVSIGLISYSLYLWHYMIFAYGRLQQSEPTIKDKLEWVLLTIILSIIFYFLIEKPFRKKTKIFNIHNLKIIIPVFLLGIIIFSLINIKNEGFKKRQLITETYLLDQRSYAFSDHYKFRTEYVPDQFLYNSNKKNILIVGNSYGEDLFKTFFFNKSLYPKYHFELISGKKRFKDTNYQVHCLKKLIINKNTICEDRNFTDNILNQYERSNVVVLSTLWKKNDLENLDEIIGLLLADDKKVIITSPSLESKLFQPHNFNLLDSLVYKSKSLLEKDINFAKKEMFKYLKVIKNEQHKKLEMIAKKNQVKYLLQSDFQCDVKNNECHILTDQKYKIYWDYGHYTNAGAKYLGIKAYEIRWFNLD
jgi:peptidoglycan/LPS O-acetylase OafA/YrhL